MNFDFSDDEKELKDTLRRLLARAGDIDSVRQVLNGPEYFNRNLWEELAKLGWLSIALPKNYGGQGLSYTALCGVAEELGHALAAVPFGSSIFLTAEALLVAGSQRQREGLLPALGNGQIIGTLAIAEKAGPLSQNNIGTIWRQNRVVGAKVAVADGMVADTAIVAARDRGRVSLFVVDLNGPGVTREPSNSVDPTRPLARLTFDNAPAERLGARGDSDWRVLETVLERAAVLFAFEQLGGADAALEKARDYALTRIAFGKPIGSFQAIKHKLADVYIANELGRSNAYYAAWALAQDAPELSLAAATARVSATEAFERGARDLIQVHGGVAITWEHDCQFYYRRSRHLATVVGTSSQWRQRLVAQLARVNDN